MATLPPPIQRSLVAKFALAVVLVALGVSAMGAWLLDRQGQRAVDQSTVEHLTLLASAVEGSFQFFDAQKQSHPAADMVAEMGRNPAVSQLHVFDAQFRIRHSLSPQDRGTMLPPEQRTLGPTTDADLVTVVKMFAPRSQCQACHSGQAALGGVYMAVERTRIQHTMLEFRVLTGFTGAAVVAALLAVVVLLTRRMIIKPIQALSHTMNSAEEGDFLVRAPIRAEDELGGLARAFNTMLAAITDLRAQELERGQTLASEQAEQRLAPQLEEKKRIIEAQNVELQARLRDLELLREVTQNLTSTLALDEQLAEVSRLLAQRLGYQEFTVMLMDHAAGVLRVAVAHGFPAGVNVLDTTFEPGEGIAGLAAQSGQTVLVKDTSQDSRYVDRSRATLPGTLLSVPMVHQGQTMGVINIYKPTVGAFDHPEQTLIENVAKQAALGIANARLFQATVEQSLTDSLTALPNRRALDARLDLELARAHRYGHPVGVLMVDVDFFKTYNDRFGHPQGDEALKRVSQALAKAVRKTDAVTRYGGEEFCVVLPRQDRAAALEVAEKLRLAVRQRAIAHGDQMPLGALTVSVGVAVYPQDGTDAATMLAAADAALYDAKGAGRDCVRAAKSPGTGA